MTVAILAAVVVIVFALGEVRYRRRVRADREQIVRALATVEGVAPAIATARKLGWVKDGDIRADGETVFIRVSRNGGTWKPRLRRRPRSQ